MYGFHYERGYPFMSEWENIGKLRMRFLGRAWLAWLLTACILLLFFSFLVSRTSASEQTLAYLSSALCFLAACAAGRQAAREQKSGVLICGVLCAASLVAVLLLCGFLIDRDSMSSDSVLSLVTLSFAGALFGSVFLSGRTRQRPRHKAFSERGNRKQKR